ncbi:unnamed protein product [Soboliphyme baturini]|uniref:PH domain-containing protein n=1 Tax=Soboliphyme baturini TaxID=241478 RepID=A0A183IZT6_9BILA|nr:unnamed protein product [Soboliphyme baturini]
MQSVMNPAPLSQNSTSLTSHEKDYVSLPLASYQIEEWESDRPYAFRIFKQTSCFDVQEAEQFIIAAATREDQLDWINSFLLFSRSVNDKEGVCQRIELNPFLFLTVTGAIAKNLQEAAQCCMRYAIADDVVLSSENSEALEART